MCRWNRESPSHSRQSCLSGDCLHCPRSAPPCAEDNCYREAPYLLENVAHCRCYPCVKNNAIVVLLEGKLKHLRRVPLGSCRMPQDGLKNIFSLPRETKQTTGNTCAERYGKLCARMHLDLRLQDSRQVFAWSKGTLGGRRDLVVSVSDTWLLCLGTGTRRDTGTCRSHGAKSCVRTGVGLALGSCTGRVGVFGGFKREVFVIFCGVAGGQSARSFPFQQDDFTETFCRPPSISSSLQSISYFPCVRPGAWLTHLVLLAYLLLYHSAHRT